MNIARRQDPSDSGSGTGGNSNGAAAIASPQTTSPPTSTSVSPSSSSSQASATAKIEGGSPSASSSTSPSAGSLTSPSASSSKSGSKDSTPYGPGALAGGIIGAAAAAAIIACVLTWLFMRRKKDRRGHRRPLSRSQSSHEKDNVYVTERAVSGSSRPEYSWQAYLPQAADDQTVKNAAKTLFDRIDNHVDNFYKNQPVLPETIDPQALAQFDSADLPAPVDQLMQDPRLALDVIKCCMALNLVKRITPSEQSTHSLLPTWLALSPLKPSSNEEREISPQVYSSWKQLGAYLRPHAEQDSVFIRTRNESAVNVADLFQAAFAPWRSPNLDRNTFLQHERGLIMTASNTGTLLMSHPCTFRFKRDHRDTNTGSGGGGGGTFTMFPSLWKTTDEHGRVLQKPQQLLTQTRCTVE